MRCKPGGDSGLWESRTVELSSPENILTTPSRRLLWRRRCDRRSHRACCTYPFNHSRRRCRCRHTSSFTLAHKTPPSPRKNAGNSQKQQQEQKQNSTRLSSSRNQLPKNATKIFKRTPNFLGFFSQIESNPDQIFTEESTQLQPTSSRNWWWEERGERRTCAEENETKKKKKKTKKQQQLRLRHCRNELVTRGGMWFALFKKNETLCGHGRFCSFAPIQVQGLDCRWSNLVFIHGKIAFCPWRGLVYHRSFKFRAWEEEPDYRIFCCTTWTNGFGIN